MKEPLSTDLVVELREAVQKLRRTPMSIKDVAALLQRAADEIEFWQQDSAAGWDKCEERRAVVRGGRAGD